MDQREEEIVRSLLDRMARLRERIEVYTTLAEDAKIEHAKLKSKLQVRFKTKKRLSVVK